MKKELLGRSRLTSDQALRWCIAVSLALIACFGYLMTSSRTDAQIAIAATRGPCYLIGLLALFIFLKACYFNLYGDARDFGYWTILDRMDQFVIGMLAAISYKRRPRCLSNHLLFPCAVVLVMATLQLQRYIGVVPFSSDWNFNVFLAGILFAVPAVLLLSSITYAMIERPFFAFKFRYTTPSVVPSDVRYPVNEVERGERKTVASS